VALSTSSEYVLWGILCQTFTSPLLGSTEVLARNPDASIEITKKEKKKEKKFSKIIDGISSDIMAGFL
jgi:hypothetical protein